MHHQAIKHIYIKSPLNHAKHATFFVLQRKQKGDGGVSGILQQQGDNRRDSFFVNNVMVGWTCENKK